MTGTAALLAVDGGNSKTDVALLDARGTVLGTARGAGASHQALGLAAAGASLADTIAVAAFAAGLESERRPVARLGVYCLAGVDLPVDERRVGTMVRSLGMSGTSVVLNDTFAILRAGTDRPWGVAVVCGAGINCVGVAPDGRTVRFPALGAISGDWGSGYWVGLEALGAAVRGRDGRGPRTALERSIPEHFGLSRPSALMEAIYLGRIAEDSVVELPPLVFAASRAGDAVARAIVDRLADEIVAMAGAAIRRLSMRRLDVQVVLGGGVFQADDARLLERIDEGVRSVAPRATLSLLDSPPLVGAALLGLDRIAGAGSDGDDPTGGTAAARVAARVRAALTHDRMRAGAPATTTPAWSLRASVRSGD